ncbi:Nop domain-containing protein [Phialemonium atrogriseum]|uniref:Nucleolar protein 56 n=1 Tax=Phialemonium atrogriseum TaxID=1093897 RepID=A0AAJ0FH71_9PEZI|nr:Nop domain-containing protein [Phialemonium atrogriseum]KAK1767397.1 Nop domain-containing protein [Phialemonium atrogriseum]
MAVNYVLHESAVGYSIYEVVRQADSIGVNLPEVKESMSDVSKFSKLVRLVSFNPWQNAASGLENINLVSEGIVSDDLKNILELNLPKTSGKKSKVVLAVSDKKLAGEISSIFPGVQCESVDSSPVAAALLRGIRVHTAKLVKDLREGDINRAQLGLGHAYSRSKVKFNVHKNDNHIIQGIATLDALDKGVNQGAMRVREWYGWHFPELVKIVSDNGTYAKLVLAVGNKKSLTDDSVDDLANLLDQDKDKAEAIVNAAKMSMGQDITEEDLVVVLDLANNVSKMAEYRRILAESLDKKMGSVAPNLQVVLGTAVAARLISHAGSLTNLAKYPASTLQILGAEKALFRALKTKSATPKYGLLYQSSFIGRAGPKVKGRISRYLANKCSIASRIDSFSEEPTNRFGQALRDQVEQRLQFYATGAKPVKNIDAMDAAMKKVIGDVGDVGIDEDMIDRPAAASTPAKEKKDKKDKKEKKEKKDKKRKSLGDVEMVDADADGERKKKKKRKSTSAE